MGVDPSLNGFAVSLPTGQVFTVGSDRSAAAWVKLGWRRLAIIRAALDHYVRAARPELFVVEDLPRHSTGNAAALGMAHGVAREVAAAHRLPIAEIVPATLKHYATGNGTADKGLMILEANRWRVAPVEDDNQADADWLRHMGEHWLGEPVSAMHRDVRGRDIWGPWKKAPGAKWPAPL
jgi:Holliday junction resolvasome RuvABC endonuclease subunit